jgi:TRAP-type C4-dicarboxylate transport system substrate-binding protein
VPQRWSARLLGLTLALLPLAGGANPEPLRLRVVGGLAGVNQYTRHEAPFWTQTLARISQGAFSADIVPFDRAGIRGQDMLRLIQLGTIPFGTALVSRSQTLDPELGAADLAGMNTDAAALRRRVAAVRPHLASMVRERHGAELLAVYAYPAQMMFCARPFGSLSELAGRRVRVANASQAELMRGLGAVPVTTEFAEVVSSVRAGHVDCAVTGSMSGNTIGLHEVTTHIHPLPISWGLSMFLANSAAWQALPAAARELLQRELPRLEAAIWEESERETAEGLACNLGRPTCAGGRAGSMRLVESASDAARLRELFASAVLPGWVRRCGAGCTRLWNEHLAPLTGVQAPAP